MKEKNLLTALLRKALGYETEEEVTEYNGEDEMIKKKVTKKQVPPDTAALKAYMSLTEPGKGVEEMTEEELSAERARLLAELSKMQEDNGEQ